MAQGLRSRIRRLAERESRRYVDIALQLVRKRTGETLLCAGGEWDQVEQRYTGREPGQVRELKIVESQVPFFRWFAPELEALAEGRPRDISVAMALGDRRAGKTVAVCGAAVATSIEVPQIGWHGLITWVVGVTRPEMQELDRYLRWMLPAAWYDHSVQQHLYKLRVGSEIHAISADDPRTLKRGEANLVLLNEGQKMPIAVLSNAIMGTVDHDGLCLIAANQPEDKRGEWVAKLQRGVRNKTLPATVVFPMDHRDNDEISQTAHGRAAGILQTLDPEAYRRDILNEDVLQEGKALPLWDPLIHVRPRPQIGLVDITPDLTYARVGRAYHYVIGQDYQGHPYMPAVVIKAFGTERLRAYLRGDLDRSQLDPQDQPQYWIIDEVVAHNSIEPELCDQMYLAGLRPEKGYCVGDASGSWQNSQHKQGDDSFTQVRSRRWHVVPPFEGRTDRDVKPLNPRIKYRVGLARWLCGFPPEEAQRRGLPGPVAPRLFIEEHCSFGRKAMEECELKPGRRTKEMVPAGFFAHYFDGATYALCHLEPRPEEHAPTGELPDMLEQALEELRRRRGAVSI